MRCQHLFLKFPFFFFEISFSQEEVSVVGTKGKLEAFGSKHGQKKENKDVANYRLALRPQSATWCPTRCVCVGEKIFSRSERERKGERESE